MAEARAAETKAKAAAKVAPARPDAGPKDYDWDGGYNIHTHINSIYIYTHSSDIIYDKLVPLLLFPLLFIVVPL